MHFMNKISERPLKGHFKAEYHPDSCGLDHGTEFLRVVNVWLLVKASCLQPSIVMLNLATSLSFNAKIPNYNQLSSCKIVQQQAAVSNDKLRH